MTIESIRKTMDFHEEYSVDSKNFTLRLYVTKRRGLYGFQFAAIIWHHPDSACSTKTTGCGYSKDASCAAVAFRTLKAPDTVIRLAESGQIVEAIVAYLKLKPRKGQSVWSLVHHAHA
jgi:hypothetical protein